MRERGPLRGVGKTALGVAMVRAWESRRADRLFDDPYAQAFVDAAPGSYPGELVDEAVRAARWGGEDLRGRFYFHTVIRTRFYDDFLTAAAQRGCRQLVLLAAGLDTRAFRLPWPDGTRLFELDLPAVLAFKEAVLTARGAVPGCERITAAADLRADWSAELVGAGFDRRVLTAWLAEGLLIYLTFDEASRMLSGVGELSVSHSRLALEHGPAAGDSMIANARRHGRMRDYTSLWKGGLGNGAQDWLTRHGWQCRFHDTPTVAACYDRPVHGPASGGFLTALRKPS